MKLPITRIILIALTLNVVLHAQPVRTPLTIDDLAWLGLFSVPATGTAAVGGPGTTSYSSGALAVRYVNGERRFLIPTFTNQDQTTGQQWGDLIEWTVPVAAPSIGTSPSLAPALVETRRWANWTALFTATTSWHSAVNGVRIGGLYWDEPNGVLWYQLYGYYDGQNRPFLAAVKLLETPTGTGTYATVGSSYGPWWYRDNNPSDTRLFWKQATGWIVPIPPSAQPDLNGRSFIVGASVGAVAGMGHIGPGFHAIAGLPALTDPSNSVIALGQRLADYSPESTQARREARRNDAYTFDGIPQSASATGLQPAVNGVGRWQMSLDQVNSFLWVETPTKEGILLFGRQAQGTTWYGYSPRSKDPHFTTGSDAVDPTRPNPSLGNGYGASAWSAALYIFDPAQVREVGRGVRSPYSDGMNPVSYNWHAAFPNLPLSTYEQVGDGAAQSRPIASAISNTGFWDARAQQIIWVQPMVINGNRPVLNLFTVNGTPPPQIPVDCVVSAWGPWSPWTPFTTTPPQEIRTATRTIVTNPVGSGMACPVLTQTEIRPTPIAQLTITGAVLSTKTCTLDLEDVPPDALGGWKVQFYRNPGITQGGSFVTPDADGKYKRSATVPLGGYAPYAVWTKTGQAVVTRAPKTLHCQPD